MDDNSFRTVIEPLRGHAPISHDTPMVMLGSCFTTEVGSRLERDGFDVAVNPMGALYNPATIAAAINRSLSRRHYTRADLVEWQGMWHCLDFPTTYCDSDPDRLIERLDSDIDALADRLSAPGAVWIITLGTAWVFEMPGRSIVGNCHKLPGNMFSRRMMTIDEIVALWQPLVVGRRIIFTVSPIRHTGDTLHGNQLSKSTLLLAVNRLTTRDSHPTTPEYFPSYEIMMDDLRDYRFYAADMKHPSDVAVDYIYRHFAATYFTPATMETALTHRRAALHAAHRPLHP